LKLQLVGLRSSFWDTLNSLGWAYKPVGQSLRHCYCDPARQKAANAPSAVPQCFLIEQFAVQVHSQSQTSSAQRPKRAAGTEAIGKGFAGCSVVASCYGLCASLPHIAHHPAVAQWNRCFFSVWATDFGRGWLDDLDFWWFGTSPIVLLAIWFSALRWWSSAASFVVRLLACCA